jgi:hypothetical protein
MERNQQVVLVPQTVHVIRAEFLQEMLCVVIESHKDNKIRGWMERHMSVPLLDDTNLVRQYIGLLALLEHNTLLDEFKDNFIRVHHDGTTYMGEAFCIIFRYVKPDFSIVLWVVKLTEWVRGLGDWYLYEIGLWIHAGSLLGYVRGHGYQVIWGKLH